MTKLSISLAAAVLSVTFAPTAGAYSFEPEHDTAIQVAAPSAQTADAEGVCSVAVTPLLAGILTLPDDWRGGADGSAQTALACADE
ncbi:hypothetical protein QTO30_00845 [Yoonia sp. GPGPB17]|uniref:hypothetical protein n=1 Tax=Yoonia sp. GPGPB17 TaxID=3026147 RepID=UPI0030C1440B